MSEENAFANVRLLQLAFLLVMIFSLLPRDAAAIGHPYLVKDINPGSGGSLSSYGPYAVLGGSIVFSAYDPDHGEELWRSDGTPDGTFLLKDIRPGSDTSNPGRLITLNGKVFFRADDGTVGTELWVTDGTVAGTTLLKDLNPGTGRSSPDYLMVSNGTLFFTATTTESGTELWMSDGTAAGTHLVKDIVPGAAGSSPSYLTDVNGTLFFITMPASNSYELWKSDGTPEGTTLIKPLPSGVYPSRIASCNGQLFFMASDAFGAELWKSDGTEAGTGMIKDINPGFAGSSPYAFACIGSTLYFSASDGVHGAEPWKSDGTAATTVMIKDIYPGISGSNPILFTGVNGTIAFVASSPGNGDELWQTDGTESGTVLLHPISPGSALGYINWLIGDGGKVIFSADDGAHGSEPWISDGTTSGTYMLGDIRAGFYPSGPRYYASTGSTFFFAPETEYGTELWAVSLAPAPHSLITSPLSGAISNALTIAGEAHSDTGSPLALVEVSTDGGANWFAASGTSAWSFDWTPAADGQYTLLSRAIDQANNLEFSGPGLTVTIDLSPPTGSVAINGTAETTNSVLVTLTVDADAVDFGVSCTAANPMICGTVSMRFSNDGVSWSAWETAKTAKSWQLLGGNGTRTVQMELKDRAGNVAVFSDTILLDTTLNPTSSITQPPSGLYTNQGTLTISGTASPGQGATLVRVEVSINGGVTWQTASGTTSWSLSVSPADGVYSITSRAIDSAGYTEIPVSGISVKIDRTPPSGRIHNNYNYGTYELDASANDPDVQICTLIFPNLCGGPMDMLLPGSSIWQPASTTLPYGTTSLWLRDRAGNVAYISQLSTVGYPIKLGLPSPQYFSSVQTAYAQSSAGDTIKVKSTSLTESLTLNRNISVTIRGGYDGTHTTTAGSTPIYGSISVQAGEVSVENVDLHGSISIDAGSVVASGVSLL